MITYLGYIINLEEIMFYTFTSSVSLIYKIILPFYYFFKIMLFFKGRGSHISYKMYLMIK